MLDVVRNLQIAFDAPSTIPRPAWKPSGGNNHKDLHNDIGAVYDMLLTCACARHVARGLHQDVEEMAQQFPRVGWSSGSWVGLQSATTTASWQV